jgi:hypothetical protein
MFRMGSPPVNNAFEGLLATCMAISVRSIMISLGFMSINPP